MFVELDDGTLVNLERVLFVQTSRCHEEGKQEIDVFIKTERSHILVNCSKNAANNLMLRIKNVLRKDKKLT